QFLCDLLPAVDDRAVERADEGGEITVTTQPAEAAARLLQAGSDPADEHAAVTPAADIVDEVPDAAVEILDRVRAAQRAVQRPGHAQALQREGFVQPFAQGGRGTGVGVVEPGGELQEAALGERGVREDVGMVDHAAHAGPHRPREMLEDVAALMDLPPLDDRRRATRLADRLAEAGPAVDDEEHCALEVEATLAQ